MRGSHDTHLSPRMEQGKSHNVMAAVCQSRLPCAREVQRSPALRHADPPSTLLTRQTPQPPLPNLLLLHSILQLTSSAESWWPSKPQSPTTSLVTVLRGGVCQLQSPAQRPLSIKLCSQLPNLKGGPSPAELGDSPDPQLCSALQRCSSGESSVWLLASAGAKQPGSRRPASTTKRWGKLRVCSRGRTHGQMLAAARPAPLLPEGLILQDAQHPSEWRGEAGRGK